MIIEIIKSHEYYQDIRLDGVLWTKQRYGQPVLTPCTVDDARDFFLDHVRKHPYDSRSHNCHSAQENLRRWLGQTVPEPTAVTKLADWLASWMPTLGSVSSETGVDPNARQND